MTTKTQAIDWTPIFKYLDDNFASKQDVRKIIKEESQFWITKIENLTALLKITDLAVKRIPYSLASKQDIKNLREELISRFAYLPTKDQFYKKMDKWMKATTTHDLEKATHKLDHSLLHTHLATPHFRSNIL